jgi:sugar phosphate isomerase/epimerase
VKISVVTDEVSSDPETALEVLHSWGVEGVELRGIEDTRYPMISDYWKVRLPQLLREFQLQVVAISPGLFQTKAPGEPRRRMAFSRGGDMRVVREELEEAAKLDRHINALLPLSIEAALQLGARSIICFSFFSRSDHTDGDPVSDEAVQIMRYAAEKVAAAGLELNIEVSEPSLRCADLVRRVQHPALGINWDPGAAFQGGEDVPFPDGFDQLRPYIRHVHFKDVILEPHTGNRIVVVDGVIDWPGAFAALRDDGFDGYISVETHRRPKVESTYRMLQRLRGLVADATTATRKETTWQASTSDSHSSVSITTTSSTTRACF